MLAGQKNAATSGTNQNSAQTGRLFLLVGAISTTHSYFYLHQTTE